MLTTFEPDGHPLLQGTENRISEKLVCLGVQVRHVQAVALLVAVAHGAAVAPVAVVPVRAAVAG